MPDIKRLLLLIPLLLSGCAATSTDTPPAAATVSGAATAPGAPTLSTDQYIGFSDAESAYWNQFNQWDATLLAGINSVPDFEKPERAAQVEASFDAVYQQRQALIVPPAFAAADALTEQGMAKMKSALALIKKEGTRHNDAFLEGAQIYAQGVDEVNATIDRLSKSGPPQGGKRL